MQNDPLSIFEVSGADHLLGGFFLSWPRLSRLLANLESQQRGHELEAIDIEAPIWICGVARGGSTILLRALAEHRQVATHRYCDFPGLPTPLWWAEQLARRARLETPDTERPHGDGIIINERSPEAMEEPLWQAWLASQRRLRPAEALTSEHLPEGFVSAHGLHLKKMLHLRGAPRYLAKANDHLSRLAVLIEMYPDARFLIPVRDPAEHVASSIRQHHRMIKLAKRSPRSRAWMRRLGHFEFGLDRRPPALRDRSRVRAIFDAFEAGEDALGYALWWSGAYGEALDVIAEHPALRAAVRWVSHNQFCRQPVAEMTQILEHCGLSAGNEAQLCSEVALQPKRQTPLNSPELQALWAPTWSRCREQLGLQGA
ncbi:MAG TPA: hypothetical protein DCQ06_09155 [Myxococcales bacterium]|nr:hypothetical protein [Myxococcales bacterium]HAN31749.1 hypothetical protein [Myxococcales bacterium]